MWSFGTLWCDDDPLFRRGVLSQLGHRQFPPMRIADCGLRNKVIWDFIFIAISDEQYSLLVQAKTHSQFFSIRILHSEFEIWRP
jgi:hypothetical protein